MRPVLTLALALLLTACASAHSFRVSGAPEYAPVPVEAVSVFESADDLPCGPDGREKLAELEASGVWWVSEDKIISEMREKAAEAGANAVVLEGFSGAGLGGHLTQGEKSQARGAALRLTCNQKGRDDGSTVD